MVSIAHGNSFLRHKSAGGSAIDGAVLFALLPLSGLATRASSGWVLGMQCCVDLLHAHFAERSSSRLSVENRLHRRFA